MTAIVLQGDALNLPLPDESVDLIVTSPPYFALRSYQDDGAHYAGQIGSEESPKEFLEALWAATREMARVLKPSGSIFVNLGDKYAGSGGHNNSNLTNKERGPKQYSQAGVRKQGYNRWADQRDKTKEWRNVSAAEAGVPAKSLMGLPWRYALGCIDDLDLTLRAEIIWAKPNGLPESVKDRVRRMHEQWFHFTKLPQYFTSVDAIREPHAEVSLKRAMPHRANTKAHEDRHEVKATQFCHPLGKLPGSVWTIPSEPLIVPAWAREKYDLPDHFAAFPTEWPRKFILGWSPDDGTVLDPFGGTGTVALVAKTLGRVGISVDLSHDYCELARWRINESGHGAKALSRTWAERQEAIL